VPASEPPRWAPAASLGLAAAGLALSVYLTIERVTAPGTLACPANAAVDCVRVTTSDQSTMFGVPVAVLGIGYFLAIGALCLPIAWRRDTRAVRGGRVALAASGVAFVVYLIYAELFLIGAVCLWCTAVHAIALALFGVIAFATAALGPYESGHRVTSARTR
jgi:uncharacterized membrane protein